MNGLPVALQVYTVRDFAEKDVEGTFAQIGKMGYQGVELAGLYGLAPEKMRAILEKNGLPAVSAHVSIHELAEDLEAAVARYMAVGCRYIAIPSLPPDMRPSGVDYTKTLDIIHKLGALCRDNGITLLYHNHDFEFNTLPDGRFELDRLYDDVPADLLQTEIDTCWVRFAGHNPADYVRKYAGRCPVVHLKDYVKDGEPARMYDLIGEQIAAADQKEKGTFEFRPVGYGVQDMPAILAASQESGARWVVVEQDSSVGRTSLEAAQLSREYLQSLGW